MSRNIVQYRKLSKEADLRIAELYVAGDSLNMLSTKFECTIDSIRRSLKREGVPSRKRGNSHKIFEQSQIDTIIAGYEAGLSQADIAQKMSVGQVQVSRILRASGVQIRGNNLRGENHHSWKGGRTLNEGGYALVYVPADHDLAEMRNRVGYCLEHRWNMALYLNRPLKTWETVHHIDGDRTNNSIENLQLRIGQHGNGQAYECADCGSIRINPRKLED